MTTEETLVALLSALPDVQALCGGMEPRVFHQYVPEQETGADAQYPCLVWELVSRRQVKCLAGSAGTGPERFQVLCFSYKSSEVKRLAAAVRGLEGKQAGVQWVWWDEEADQFDPPVENMPIGLRGVSVDLILWP